MTKKKLAEMVEEQTGEDLLRSILQNPTKPPAPATTVGEVSLEAIKAIVKQAVLEAVTQLQRTVCAECGRPDCTYPDRVPEHLFRGGRGRPEHHGYRSPRY